MPQSKEPSEQETFFSVWLRRTDEGVAIWQHHCTITLCFTRRGKEEGEAQMNEEGERRRGTVTKRGEEKNEKEKKNKKVKN